MGVDQNIQSGFRFRVLPSRDAFVDAAVEFFSDVISATTDQVHLALSGGSTPKPVYEALSAKQLDWDRVSATLVDDRITDDVAGSNAAMVRSLLARDRAAAINFYPLDEYNFDGSELDLTIMGMGTDGHTASWFPGSIGLAEALDPNSGEKAIAINAKGSPGAGDYLNRLTMTLPVVMNSRQILLLMTGEEKRRVFEQASQKSVFDAPVKALLAAGPRLTVLWTP